MYDNVEELSDAATSALKQYIDLVGGGSAVLLYSVDRQNVAKKQAEVLNKIAEEHGVKSGISSPATTIKETAESLHKKIQEYKANSPEFVVNMFEEGLSFLESLCERYM